MSEKKNELTERLLGENQDENEGLRKISTSTLIQMAETKKRPTLKKKRATYIKDPAESIDESDLMNLELEKYYNKLLGMKPAELKPKEKSGQKAVKKADEKPEEKPKEKSKGKEKSAKQIQFDNYVKSIHEKTKELIETPFRILDPVHTKGNAKQPSSKLTEIKCIALSPDQSKLVIGGNNAILCIFDINDEKSVPRSYELSKNEVIMAVAYSPKGDLILGGTNKGSLIIFNTETELEVAPRRSIGQKTVCKTVAFSADGESLIVGDDNGKLKIFPLVGEESQCVDDLDHKGEICSYAYSNSIKKHATGGDNNILYLFQLSENSNIAEEKITINAHKGSVRSLAFSNDGRYLLSGSYDKTAKLFDTSTGKELMTYKGHSDPVLAVAISPDSVYVLTGGRDCNSILFNRQNGEIIHTFEEYDEIRAVLFLDCTKIITAEAGGKAKVYSLEKNQFFRGNSLHYTVADNAYAEINCIDVSIKNNKVVTGGDDCMVRLYDLETAFEIKKFAGNEGPVFAVKLSPDGKIVLSGGDDCILRLYDVYSGALACSFEHHNGDIMSIIFSPDHNEFATGGEDKTINIYNFIKREQVTSCPLNREKQKKDLFLQCMVYSPNGKWIVFGGYDTIHNGGIGVYSREDNTKTNLEDLDDMKEIIDLEFANDLRLIAISELMMYMIEFRNADDLTQYDIINTIDVSENYEFKSVAIKKILNEFTIFTTSNTEDEFPESIIEVWDHELNKVGKIYDTSKDDGDEITSKISFVGEDRLIFGTSLGVPKLMIIERDENDDKKFTKLTETYFTQEVLILTVDDSGKRVALCTKAGNIRIINILSGRLLNNNNEIYLENLLSCYETVVTQNSQKVTKKEKKKRKEKEEEEEEEAGEDEEEKEEKEKSQEKSRENEISGEIERSDNEEIEETEENDDKIKITSLRFTDTPEVLIIGMSDGTLLVYNYEKEEMKNIIREKEIKELVQIEYFKDKNQFYIFSGFDDGTISIADMNKQKQFKITALDSNNPTEEKNIMLLCPFKHTYTINKTVVSILKMQVLYHDGSVECFEINEDGVSKPSIVLDPLKEPVLCASHSRDFSKIITGGEDNKVRIYDISTKGEKIFEGHEDKISSVSFLSDIRYAASASWDDVFKIFEIESGNELFTYTFDVTIENICVSPLMETIVCGTSCGLRLIYSVLTPRKKIENFSRIGNILSDEKKSKNFKLAAELKPDSFDLLPIQLDLSLIHMKLVYAEDKIQVIDVLKEVAEFLTSNADDPSIDEEKKKYLCECVFRKDAVYSLSPWKIWIKEARNNKVIEQMVYEKLTDILLCPQMVHVEKMKGKAEFIEKIAQRCPGRLQEVLDVFWKSTDPLTIRVKRMDTLMKIKYYWNCFLGIIDIFMSKRRFLMKIELPMVLHTKNSTPCTRIMRRKYEKETLLYKSSENSDADVTYFKSFVKISKISLEEFVNLSYYDQFKPGAKQKCSHSKFLLEMFTNFPPEHTLFKSELLKTVVNYLWGLQECIGFAFYRRLLLFFLFQLLIGMNCLFFIPERQASADLNNPNPPHEAVKEYYRYASLISDSAIIFILGFLFIMRNVKIINLFRMYKALKYSTVFSFWNMLDYLICILGFITFGLDLYWTTHMENDTGTVVWTKYLLALFFATTWFKLIEFARGFSKTSALVRLLYEVTKDMLIFLLTILFMVVGLAFAMFILQKSYLDNNLWHYFKITYGILIGNSGDFKDEKEALNSELYFVILFFATLYLVIIMLNLLIAIVNNSFGNVLAKESQNEIFEKLKIINNRIYEFTSAEKDKLLEKIEKDFLFQLKLTDDEQKEEEKQDSNKEGIQATITNLEQKIDSLLDQKLDNLLKKLGKNTEKN